MTDRESDDAVDRLEIRGLELRCVVGAEEWERRMSQRVVVDIELRGDFAAAAESDELMDAVDYRVPCVRAAEIASEREYRLVETLADRIARAVLGTHECISEVRVSVFKPLALAGFGSAEARMEVRRGR